MDNRPIGIFDSGLGGLTCIPYLIEEFPEEKMIYFGDTKRAPYGGMEISTITSYSTQITDFLVQSGVKMVIIACNTISAISFDTLRARHPGIPIIGIIKSAAEKTAKICTSDSRIGVIGTKATVASRIYDRFIKNANRDLNVFSLACPAFVPLIEEGITESEIMDLTIKYYLDDFIAENKIDTVVLGCTHYALIQKNIERIYPGLRIVNPSQEILSKIRKELTGLGLLAEKSDFVNTFYASDLSEVFTAMIDRIFENTDVHVKFKSFEIQEGEFA
ncbi:MAG: glutamate racemase [Clostridiales bacterium]|nr:glutamate racemase [Clostridiales bacterium]